MSAPAPTRYEALQAELRRSPKTWLITGVAGFIRSNLLEKLLGLDQTVVGLDNFSTGHRRNLDEVRTLVTPAQWARFRFLEGDIRNLDDCRRACQGVNHVLHQAALGSVPRSLADPLRSHASNVDGFLHMLTAVRRPASSVSCMPPAAPSMAITPRCPRSNPTSASRFPPTPPRSLICEVYAQVFSRCYGLGTTGLRYFNVFGPRQDPAGAYAAVIPKWFPPSWPATPSRNQRRRRNQP